MISSSATPVRSDIFSTVAFGNMILARGVSSALNLSLIVKRYCLRLGSASNKSFSFVSGVMLSGSILEELVATGF